MRKDIMSPGFPGGMGGPINPPRPFPGKTIGPDGGYFNGPYSFNFHKNLFMGHFPPGPPPDHGPGRIPPHPPHPPHHPPFFPPPLFLHGEDDENIGTIFPFKKKVLKEFQKLFLLEIISMYKDGITAYRLDSYFGFPRTSALRILDELEADKYISYKLISQDGREQKLFQITEEGRRFLEDLKKRWAKKIIAWHEIIPPEKFEYPFNRNNIGNVLKTRIEEASTKEEVEDILHGIRADLTLIKRRYEERLKSINESIGSITEVLNELKLKQEFKTGELRDIIDRAFS